jgi:hypothetical protein
LTQQEACGEIRDDHLQEVAMTAESDTPSVPEAQPSKAGVIQVYVVPPPDKAGQLGSANLVERFENRVDELGGSIGQIANRLRARLDADLRDEQDPKWRMEEVAVTFSLDLEAEGGVVVAKARAKAGFEVELKWKRA